MVFHPVLTTLGAAERAKSDYAAVDVESTLTCARCGSAFRPYRAWQRFCSPECRNGFHTAERTAAVRAARGPA